MRMYPVLLSVMVLSFSTAHGQSAVVARPTVLAAMVPTSPPALIAFADPVAAADDQPLAEVASAGHGVEDKSTLFYATLTLLVGFPAVMTFGPQFSKGLKASLATAGD